LRDLAPQIPVVLVTMGGIRATPGPVASYPTPDEATEAIAHAAAYAEWRDLPRDNWYELDEERAFAARRIAGEILERRGTHWLEPAEQEALPGPYGIRPLGETVVGHLEAGAAARRIGYPVAVKVAGAEVVHKTDRGLVRVGLTNSAGVVAAVRDFEDELNRSGIPVLVQPVAKGPELAIGISRHPAFGPVVMVAAGGVATDLLADRAFLVPPLSRRDVARALRSLRMWPLLDGFRGAPLVDTSAIEELILQVGNLARDLPELAELDLNPVIATPEGPVVVDVKAHLRHAEEFVGATPRQLSRLRRTPERRRGDPPERHPVGRHPERDTAGRRTTDALEKETPNHV
jgi:acyl-CoA synthetase (NDP forming)